MTYINDFPVQNFLENYWQTRTILFRNAYSISQDLITGEELAGLACEQDIDARLVFANEDQSEWKCEYAPFEDSDFTSLENKNWTLLVQAVDHYIPEARTLLNDFGFLPKWRLDDVMLSYSTPGGGVGPHFDYYDVFLIQTSGSREWKIGQTCDASTPLRPHEDLKLLDTFTENETYILNAGDMIYIPAGVAHWGTALSDHCITASVGFRAPSYRELLLGSIEEIANKFNDDQRYTDAKIKSNNDSYLIDETVGTQLEAVWNDLNKQEFIENLTEQFSLQVTEPRHEELIESQNYSLHSIQQVLITKKTHIKHHPVSRFAYRKSNDNATLFVNGFAFNTNLATAYAICHSDYTDADNLDARLIQEIVNNGSLIIEQ